MGARIPCVEGLFGLVDCRACEQESDVFAGWLVVCGVNERKLSVSFNNSIPTRLPALLLHYNSPHPDSYASPPILCVEFKSCTLVSICLFLGDSGQPYRRICASYMVVALPPSYGSCVRSLSSPVTMR